jgi:hypothetical protein
MDGLTIAQLMNVAAWGLGIGTTFFSLFGIRAEKDVFLVTGLLACMLGNVAMCLYLNEQEGMRNDTIITIFGCFGLLSAYATFCQLDKYRWATGVL